MNIETGDLVRIIKEDSPNRGKILRVTGISVSHKGNTTYMLENKCAYYDFQLLKIAYKVGDMVKCIKKGSPYFSQVYTVTDIERYPIVKVHNGFIFYEDEIEKVYHKFKVGDKIKIHNPYSDNHGKVCTVTEVNTDGTYKLTNVVNVIAEGFLEACNTPEFKIGDWVMYNKPTTVYKVIGYSTNGYLEIKDLNSGRCFTNENTDLIRKVKFQKNETVIVKDINTIGNIDYIRYNMGTIGYKVSYYNSTTKVYSHCWTPEYNLESVDYVTSSTNEAGSSDNSYINKLKNKEKNENQLQRKDNPGRTEDVTGKGGFFGRRAKSSVSVGHLSNQARVGCSRGKAQGT